MYQKDEPGSLFHFLHHAHKRQVQEGQRTRGCGDMGMPMLLITLFAAEKEEKALSQRELARQLRISPATVAVSLRSLERSGYISRAADRQDQRRNLVSLTEKGREAVQLCGEIFRSVDEQMLAGFTGEERAQLNGFFLRMLANLGVKAEDVPPPPIPAVPNGDGHSSGKEREG